MGFFLKLIFIYFLIKFLWSITKRPLLNKAQQKMSEKIKKAMDDQIKKSREAGDSDYSNSYNEVRKENQKSDIIDAEYRVIKK